MTTYVGYHSQFTAQPGRADELQEIVLAAAEGLRSNDKCLLYVVSRSPDDPNVVWVTEAWTTREAHDASLRDEAVKAAVQRAMPLIAGIARTELAVAGGKGI
jgi:quinol monooxygenase YgiN